MHLIGLYASAFHGIALRTTNTCSTDCAKRAGRAERGNRAITMSEGNPSDLVGKSPDRRKLLAASTLARHYWLRVSDVAGLREHERPGEDLRLPLRRDDFV